MIIDGSKLTITKARRSLLLKQGVLEHIVLREKPAYPDRSIKNPDVLKVNRSGDSDPCARDLRSMDKIRFVETDPCLN